MTMNKKLLLLITCTLLTSELSFAADDEASEFEKFKNQQTQGVKEIKNEFDKYKKDLGTRTVLVYINGKLGSRAF